MGLVDHVSSIDPNQLHSGLGKSSSGDQETRPGLGNDERNRRESSLWPITADVLERVHPVFALMLALHVGPPLRHGVALDNGVSERRPDRFPILHRARLKVEVEWLACGVEGQCA